MSPLQKHARNLNCGPPFQPYPRLSSSSAPPFRRTRALITPQLRKRSHILLTHTHHTLKINIHFPRPAKLSSHKISSVRSGGVKRSTEDILAMACTMRSCAWPVASRAEQPRVSNRKGAVSSTEIGPLLICHPAEARAQEVARRFILAAQR